jgi:hypothetical protein
MELTYEFDDGNTQPLESPADYDNGDTDATRFWDNNCGATKKQCAGQDYYGGYNECAQGHEFSRTFEGQRLANAHKVVLKGTVWTIDSWDGETFTVELRD